jgi:hypothetical protein
MLGRPEVGTVIGIVFGCKSRPVVYTLMTKNRQRNNFGAIK